MSEERVLTVGSLFAGVGGFDAGLEATGMQTLWQVEIDEQCRQVLARHFPDATRYEDVTDVGGLSLDEHSLHGRREGGSGADPQSRDWLGDRLDGRDSVDTGGNNDGRTNLAPVDLICGGFPCQDLSVAGRRAGLAGERSGLFFEFIRIAREVAPRWILVENVPGLLSSNGGADFGIVLRELTGFWPQTPPDTGWRSAGVCEGPRGRAVWRVLDTQYFGPPQRRSRVFIVVDTARRCGPEILFEPEGLPWHPAPSREAGEGATHPTSGCLAASGRGTGRVGKSRGQDPVVAVNTGRGYWTEDGLGRLSYKRAAGIQNVVTGQYHGSNVGEVGARTIGLGSDPLHTLEVAQPVTNRNGDPGVVLPFDTTGVPFVTETLRVGGRDQGAGDSYDNTPWVLPFDTTQITSKLNRSRPEPGDPCHTLAKGAHAPAIAPTINASGAGTSRPGGPRLGSEEEYHPVSSGVLRRLTPTECERLHGFHDDWTAWGIDEDGEPVEMADTPRYQMLGNAVSVPVAEWIGRRILEAHEATEGGA